MNAGVCYRCTRICGAGSRKIWRAPGKCRSPAKRRLARDRQRVAAGQRAQLVIRLRHSLDGAAVLRELEDIRDADRQNDGALRQLTDERESRRVSRHWLLK